MVQRSVSATAGAEPTNRGVPSASKKFARGISGIKLPNGRIGRRRALLVAQHEAVQVDALPLPQALVGREEERPAAPDRTARSIRRTGSG